jgi:hypothetical protein
MKYFPLKFRTPQLAFLAADKKVHACDSYATASPVIRTLGLAEASIGRRGHAGVTNCRRRACSPGCW